jgi:hypothetical protein
MEVSGQLSKCICVFHRVIPAAHYLWMGLLLGLFPGHMVALFRAIPLSTPGSQPTGTGSGNRLECNKQ